MTSRPLPAGLRRDRRVDLANRINSTVVRLLRRIAQDDGADGVTGARASALSVLVYGGGATLGALARVERVAPPTMSRIVSALVRDGLVAREPVPGDRRAARLVATTVGRTMMERGRSRRIVRLADELGTLSRLDLEAVARAIAILGRLERAAVAPAGTTSRGGAAPARHSAHQRPSTKGQP